MYTRGGMSNTRGIGRSSMSTRGTRSGGGSYPVASSARGFSGDVGCFYCGKKGHWAKECYKKQRDLANGRRVNTIDVVGYPDDTPHGNNVQYPPAPPKN